MVNQTDTSQIVVRSEFAIVAVSLDRDANGQRLKVEDLGSGSIFYFDALELERLAAARHEDLAHIVAPEGAVNGQRPRNGLRRGTG